MNLTRLIIWSIIGTGISSVTTQLLTIREFLSQFHGNEITISLVLFSWLLITGLGSLAGKVLRYSSPTFYSVLVMIVSLAPLAQILVIRLLRDTFFAHGTAPGFYPIFFYILFTTAPYCLLIGFVLPYALTVLHDLRHPFTSGDLYVTDSIGDIAGGVLFSFFLVYWMMPFQTIALSSSFLLLTALLLQARLKRYLLLTACLLFCSIFYYCSYNTLFEMNTIARQYGEVVNYLESPYGRIVVSREGDQFTLWESGVPVYSGENIIKSEEKIHYPLCQIDHVEDVLLVSGGLGKTLAEVRKYGPARVDYVELDPNLTGEALRLGMLGKAPFPEIMNTDGRRYIKTAKRRYDAICMDLPDPDTFQVNRFFTSEFFRHAKRILKKGGVLSLSMEYSPNYISEIRRQKLSTLYNTARRHFENVMVLPGEEAYFICRDGVLSPDIPSRLRMKSIKTSYIEGFFYGDVSRERIGQLQEVMDREEYINTDFEPRLMNIVFREWFMKHGASPGYFLMFLSAFTLVYLMFIRREEYVLFSTGLATMGAEMVVLFAFQVIYGYIYLKIGAIVTAFLVGLLPGAVIGNLWSRNKNLMLAISEIFILCLLLLFFLWVAFLRGEPHPLWFLAYCFSFSFACGFQFPVAADMIGERSSPAAGCLAADLCGASVGTLVTGTILIPLWGIQSALIFLILVKISSGIIVVFGGRPRT